MRAWQGRVGAGQGGPGPGVGLRVGPGGSLILYYTSAVHHLGQILTQYYHNYSTVAQNDLHPTILQYELILQYNSNAVLPLRTCLGRPHPAHSSRTAVLQDYDPPVT